MSEIFLKNPNMDEKQKKIILLIIGYATYRLYEVTIPIPMNPLVLVGP